MRAERRAPVWLALLALAACAPADEAPLRIAAPGFEPSGRGWTDAALVDGPERRDVALRVLRARPLDDLQVDVGVYAERGGDPLGRLVLAPPDALLHYRAAGAAGFDPVAESRLALLSAGPDAAEARLALFLEGDALDAEGIPLQALAPDALARLLAAAQALGAWDVLERSHVAERDGRARLPFFAPRERDDWSRLAGASLESLLPDALAARLARDPALRTATQRRLFAQAKRLDELADEVERLAGAPGLAAFAIDPAPLLDAIRLRARVFLGYLDSVWVEKLVRLEPEGHASVTLFVHSVVPVTLLDLRADMGRNVSLLEKVALAGLTLADPEAGRRRSARLAEGLVFPIERRVEPVALGPERYGTQRLELRLEGLERAGDLLWRVLDGLTPRLRNEISGELVAEDHVTGFATLRDPRFGARSDTSLGSLRAELGAQIEAEPGSALRLGPERLELGAGRYRVLDDLILPEGLGLVLEAGAELRVAPGRSILVRGPVSVRGTPGSPVRITGLSASEPWGVLAVQGKRALDGRARLSSEMRHLEIEGGSEDYLRGAYYSGQLSVYHQDLVLEHARISGARADDALNVKYAHVAIRDCEFVDNRADAVDLDWVEGSIERSLFAGSGDGGDGLDLSGSRVEVDDSVFADAEDKCVSVGERSELELRGSLLRGCALGLASKDLSLARVADSLFLSNRRDLAAYRKKAVFGGGRIVARGLVRVAPGGGDERDAESEIALEDVLRVEERDLAANAELARLADARRFSRARLEALRAALTPGY